MRPKTDDEIRSERRQVADECRRGVCDKLLTVAPLWPKTGENLGTVLRTCDAVGAHMVAPHSGWRRVRSGNTIGWDNAPVHWVGDADLWLRMQYERRDRPWIVAVELAHDATSLDLLPEATHPKLILVGNEAWGFPKRALRFVDEFVEIPMKGVGNSLNVAVAASLVLYKLAGFS